MLPYVYISADRTNGYVRAAPRSFPTYFWHIYRQHICMHGVYIRFKISVNHARISSEGMHGGGMVLSRWNLKLQIHQTLGPSCFYSCFNLIIPSNCWYIYMCLKFVLMYVFQLWCSNCSMKSHGITLSVHNLRALITLLNHPQPSYVINPCLDVDPTSIIPFLPKK